MLQECRTYCITKVTKRAKNLDVIIVDTVGVMNYQTYVLATNYG